MMAKDFLDPNKVRDLHLRSLQREDQRLKEIERLNAELPLGPVKDPEGVDFGKTERLDHIVIVMDQDSESKWLTSARGLARAIQRRTLGCQDGRSPKLKMRRPLSKKEEPLEILTECVILTLGESEARTRRIGQDWRLGPDAKKASEKLRDLPMYVIEQWLGQEVRRLYAEWEPDGYKNRPDDPGLRTRGQRGDEDEDSNPLDSLIATSRTMTPFVNPLDSLVAAETLDKGLYEFSQLINAVAPKEQKFLFTLLQVQKDYPGLTDNQAFAKTRQILDISDTAGYQLLYRIRKTKKVC